MNKLSIVMVSWNDYRNTNNRLLQFINMMDKDMELIWVDQASIDSGYVAGKPFWFEAFKKMGKSLSLYSLKENVGFQAGYNYGVSKATGNVILITQPDVVFSDNDLFSSIQEARVDNSLVLGGRLISWDGGWNSLVGSDEKKYIVPYLEGWLLVMARKTWDDIGGFDLQYFPADMEDVDLSLTALSKGYGLAELEPKVFTHIGGQSFASSSVSGNARLERTKINKEKFDNKWKDKLQFIFGGN